ncbi:hypothetical protein Tco_1523413 [Tanacetum coccineum]
MWRSRMESNNSSKILLGLGFETAARRFSYMVPTKKVEKTPYEGPQEDTPSTQTRMCLYIDAEEHELGDLGEPANYKAALLDPESDKWLLNAMNVENCNP